MNELIEAWEDGAGVRHFLVLTAQANEAHLEALSTIRTAGASVLVVDVFAFDFGTLLEMPEAPVHGGELDTSLMLHLAPELVRMDLAQDVALSPELLARFRPGAHHRLPEHSPGSVGYPSRASAEKGARAYAEILERLARWLPAY